METGTNQNAERRKSRLAIRSKNHLCLDYVHLRHSTSPVSKLGSDLQCTTASWILEMEHISDTGLQLGLGLLGFSKGIINVAAAPGSGNDLCRA